MNDLDRRRSPERESIDTRVALLEEILRTISGDLRSIREAATDGLAMLEKRIVMLEDVRVRALEDWRLSRKVLETARSSQFSRLEKWAAFVATCVVTIVAALIASHAI